MANSTEDHRIILEKSIFQVATPSIILAGLMIQLFIVAVNVNDWKKGRSITSVDKIITSIGISRVFLHVAFFLISVPLFKLPRSCHTMMVFTAQSSAFSSMYLSTLLSFFFYFKISTSHNVFLLHLKSMISRRVVHLIVASLPLSVVYSTMYIGIFYSIGSDMHSGHHDHSSHEHDRLPSYYILLCNIPPLLMVLTASLLLIILLGFHMSKMNKRGNVRISTDTYQRTMSFTLGSLLSWVVYVLVYMINSWIHVFDKITLYFILNIFPALLSLLLIYAATKLRNQFLRIVHCGTRCLPNRKTSNPRDPMEMMD